MRCQNCRLGCFKFDFGAHATESATELKVLHILLTPVFVFLKKLEECKLYFQNQEYFLCFLPRLARYRLGKRRARMRWPLFCTSKTVAANARHLLWSKQFLLASQSKMALSSQANKGCKWAAAACTRVYWMFAIYRFSWTLQCLGSKSYYRLSWAGRPPRGLGGQGARAVALAALPQGRAW